MSLVRMYCEILFCMQVSQRTAPMYARLLFDVQLEGPGATGVLDCQHKQNTIDTII